MQPHITRVAILQGSQCFNFDQRDDLHYAVPVKWAAHGGDGVAPHHELVASHRKSCVKQQGNQAKSNANARGNKVRFSQPEATAAMTGLPAVNASSGGADLI
jgi:hypothetical protein